MNTKRILIIGGSGHVSGAVTRAALADDHEVTIITRGQKPLPEGVTALTADRKDTAAMRAVLPEDVVWDLVVDCIGYEPEDARQDVELFADRARQFVFISTDFVFDPAQRRFPQPFDNPYSLHGDSYGAKKRRCELEFIHCGAGADGLQSEMRQTAGAAQARALQGETALRLAGPSSALATSTGRPRNSAACPTRLATRGCCRGCARVSRCGWSAAGIFCSSQSTATISPASS